MGRTLLKKRGVDWVKSRLLFCIQTEVYVLGYLHAVPCELVEMKGGTQRLKG